MPIVSRTTRSNTVISGIVRPALFAASTLFALVGSSSAFSQTPATVRPRPFQFDVSLRKRGPAEPLVVGQTATFTLHPFNSGSAPAGGMIVTVTDTLPANFTAPITATGSGWNCTIAGLVVTCVYTGPVVKPQRPFPEITIAAVAGREGRYRNCADIAMRRRPEGPKDAATVPAIKDPNPRDNRDCVNGTIKPGEGGGGGGGGGAGHDVSIRKRGPGTPVAVGQGATFTLSPHNNGPSSVSSGGAIVTDTLPVNFIAPIAASGMGWNCTVTGQVVRCVYAGSPVGAQQPFAHITITAVAGSAGSYRNCADIALRHRNEGPKEAAGIAGIKDSNPRDNRDCVDGRIGGGKQSYNVSLRKLGGGTVAAGGQITFTFSPFNLGPDAVGAITIVDTLPAGLSSVSAPTGTPWSCSVNSNVLTCSYNGAPIAQGTSFPSMSFQATASTAGSFSNCASLSLNGLVDTDVRDNRDCRAYEVTGDARPGILTIVKEIATKDVQDFMFHAFGPNSGQIMPFYLDDDAGADNQYSSAKGFTLPAGSYSVSEDLLAGWTVSNIACSPASSGTIDLSIRAFTVNLTAGTNVTCTFTNVKDTPAPQGTASITIIKIASPNDPQDFSFTASGQGVYNFALDDDPSNGTLNNSVTFSNLMPGTYTFAETAVNGWTSGGTGYGGTVNCTDIPNPTRSTFTPTPDSVLINLVAGDAVTCTFINTKQPVPTGTASLTIIKDAAPDDAQDFHFTVSGPGLTDFWLDDDPSDGALPKSKTFTNLAVGVPFTVTEDALPGWTVPSLQCIPDIIGTSTTYTDQLNRTFTVSMAAGVHMTCTFKNVR